MGKEHPDTNAELYSDIIHKGTRKRHATDDMSADEIIDYIIGKL